LTAVAESMHRRRGGENGWTGDKMIKYRDVLWKRNLRKIPDHVSEQLKDCTDKRFVVGVVRTVSNTDLEAGAYRHLGLGIAAGGIIFKECVIPIAEMGIFSRRNREGWEIRRDDLPMVTRTFSIETPNYGDWGNGSHTMEWDRDCYQYDYVDAPQFAVHVQILKHSSHAAVFSFILDWPLDRAAEDFERDLLFALNILQENVGAAGLLAADASSVELLASIEMRWEFFPPGTAPEIERFFRGTSRSASPDLDKVIRERTELFMQMKPLRYLRGIGGMNRYIGAQFADDFVVFENVRYGNAIWVLFEEWSAASRRSRIDLLRLRDVPYHRIVHSEGWQDRLPSSSARRSASAGSWTERQRLPIGLRRVRAFGAVVRVTNEHQGISARR